MRLSLVIFDCDGVLIDSEMLACGASAKLLTDLGLQISTKDYINEFAGVSNKDKHTILKSKYKFILPDDYEDQVKEVVQAIFEEELTAITGIHEVLDGISLPVCVASSSTPERLKHSLTLTSLYDRLMPDIFSSVLVKNGKPAPDLFLYSAEKMGVAPENCAVIEDSPAGVKSACAAGMRALGFAGGSHCFEGHAERLDAEGATGVFDKMSELPQLIEQIQKPVVAP